MRHLLLGLSFLCCGQLTFAKSSSVQNLVDQLSDNYGIKVAVIGASEDCLGAQLKSWSRELSQIPTQKRVFNKMIVLQNEDAEVVRHRIIRDENNTNIYDLYITTGEIFNNKINILPGTVEVTTRSALEISEVLWVAPRLMKRDQQGFPGWLSGNRYEKKYFDLDYPEMMKAIFVDAEADITKLEIKEERKSTVKKWGPVVKKGKKICTPIIPWDQMRTGNAG